MAANKAGTPRPNSPTAGAPCVDFLIRLDGGSGTPVILAAGGDRDGMVDYTSGTNGVTDNGPGDHYIHVKESWNDLVIYPISGAIVVGDTETVTNVVWSAANKRLEVTLSADTAGVVNIFGRAYLNAQNK